MAGSHPASKPADECFEQVCVLRRSIESTLSITASSLENRATEYVFLWASGVDDDGLIFNRAHEPKMRVAFLTVPGFPELAYPVRDLASPTLPCPQLRGFRRPVTRLTPV
jgi:hypothetical protein